MFCRKFNHILKATKIFYRQATKKPQLYDYNPMSGSYILNYENIYPINGFLID
jgi:hypothetical protein